MNPVFRSLGGDSSRIIKMYHSTLVQVVRRQRSPASCLQSCADGLQGWILRVYEGGYL